jgi:hypothetical protein
LKLAWKFACLPYIFHFLYTFFGIFDGSVANVFARQGPLIAGPNFLLTVWWGLDAALLWLGKSPKWLRVLHVAAVEYVFLVFVVATVFLFEGVPRLLGLILLVRVIVFLAWRCYLADGVSDS